MNHLNTIYFFNPDRRKYLRFDGFKDFSGNIPHRRILNFKLVWRSIIFNSQKEVSLFMLVQNAGYGDHPLKTSQPPAPPPPYSPSHRRLRAAPESSAPGKAPGRCRRCSGSASRLPGKRPRKDAAGRPLRCGNDILMKPFLEIGCRLFLLLGFPVASFIRTNPFY